MPPRSAVLALAGFRAAALHGRVSGVALCVGTAWAAIWIAKLQPVPAPFVALLLGLAGHRIAARGPMVPGIETSARGLLRLGVALLGARLSLGEIMRIGAAVDLVAVAALLSCLATGLLVGRLLRLPADRALIGAGAVAICGASAALALAAIFPRDPARGRHTACTVAAVTLLSTAAMLLYPAIALALGLGAHQAGAFFGASIHDLAQVLGAGAAISPAATDAAAVSKLVRVACLMPVAAAAALLVRRSSADADARGSAPILPAFLLGFVCLALLGGAGLVPPQLARSLAEASSFLLVMATAALGFLTRPAALLGHGWRPLVLILVQTAVIAAVALGLSIALVPHSP